MMTKKILRLAMASGLLMSAVGMANAESVNGFSASANVTLTSDYKFRGISQSDESPAIQGGFDIEHESGFYIGVWGSSVDFDTNGPGYDGSLELDYYGGFSHSITETLAFDVGYIYYDYPGDNGPEGDYQEVYGSLSFNDLTIGVNYSDDYYAETGDFWYVYGDYSYTLPKDFVISAHLGYNSVDKDGGFLSNGEDSFTTYSIGVSKEFSGVEWALAYVGTDLDKKDVFDTKWGEPQAVFSLSKSL